MTKHTVTGEFSAADLGSGSWRIAAAAPAAATLYLQGAGADAALVLRDRRITRIGLEWRAEGVVVSVTGASGFRYFKCRGAVIHEPKPQLYANLPLAAFDAAARRFWGRVFWVIRFPGGRWVIRQMARRGRVASRP